MALLEEFIPNEDLRLVVIIFITVILLFFLVLLPLMLFRNARSEDEE